MPIIACWRINQDRLSEKECNARRHLPVGRPFPSNLGLCGIFSRIGGGSERSVYNVCASGAGPRRIPIAATSIKRIQSPVANVNTSPICTWCDGLVIRVPFTRTLPSRTNFVARLRDLKNRACQSHLSMRSVLRTYPLTPSMRRTGCLDPVVFPSWQVPQYGA